MKLLEEIEKERADIKERQAELVKKKAKLNEIIDQSKSNIVDNSPAVRIINSVTINIGIGLIPIAERRQERQERQRAQTPEPRRDGLRDVWSAYSCFKLLAPLREVLLQGK